MIIHNSLHNIIPYYCVRVFRIPLRLLIVFFFKNYLTTNHLLVHYKTNVKITTKN